MQQFDLSSDFIKNIQNSFGEEGRLWLSALPDLIAEATRCWNLTEVQPVSNLSYNYVAFAQRNSEDVVLKIGVPNRELTSEMAALRFFNGVGAVRLLEADEKSSSFLLERLMPGEMLSTLENDDQATQIAADSMLRLWRPAPSDTAFIRLSDWFKGLDNLRPAFDGGTGPFPGKLIEEVEELLPQLFAESRPPLLIHGDFHHFNILQSARGWLVIDPKGVIGHPEYEAGPLLMNPMPDLLKQSNPKARIERRIAILSERLGFSQHCLRDWGLCHAVLSTWWDMSPEGVGGDYSLACAKIISTIHP